MCTQVTLLFLHTVQIDSFQALIAIIMLIPADIGSLLNFFSFTAWLFYGAVALALLILRYKWKDVHRPFKVCTLRDVSKVQYV